VVSIIRVFGNAMLKHLYQGLPLGQSLGAFRRGVRARARALRGENQPWRQRGLPAWLLWLLCLLLAADEAIRPAMPEQAARVALIRQAMRRAYRGVIRFAVRFGLGFLPLFRRPLVPLGRVYRLVNRVFGRALEVDYSTDRETYFYADVRRCQMFAFFEAHGAPALTRVMCGWDRNWFEEIDPERHGVRFTRDRLISSGDPLCAFHFERAKTAPAEALEEQ